MQRYHEGIEDDLEALRSFEKAQQSQNAETSQDCECSLDTEGSSLLRYEDADEGANDNHKVKDVPCIAEIGMREEGDQFNGSLDNEKACEEVITDFSELINLCWLAVPMNC